MIRRIEILRAKGGHLAHLRQVGAEASLCGHVPQDRWDSSMQRAGWKVYVRTYGISEFADHPCKGCGKMLETLDLYDEFWFSVKKMEHEYRLFTGTKLPGR